MMLLSNIRSYDAYARNIILDWPDDLDYSFIRNLKYDNVEIIGSINIFDLNRAAKLFKIWKPVDLFVKHICLSNVISMEHDEVYLETIERIPKKYFLHILPEMKKIYKNIVEQHKIKYLEENLDLIYDEIMIKGIIE